MFAVTKGSKGKELGRSHRHRRAGIAGRTMQEPVLFAHDLLVIKHEGGLPPQPWHRAGSARSRCGGRTTTTKVLRWYREGMHQVVPLARLALTSLAELKGQHQNV